MPKLDDEAPLGVFSGLFLIVAACVACGCLGLLIYWKPWWVLGAMAVIGLATFAEAYRTKRTLARLASGRSDRTICAFARQFDCRRIDTWIIRATWEQMQNPAQTKEDGAFPLRRTDRLWEDLRLDGDDVDDIGDEIARRAGRSWENAEHNPFYDRVVTVGDLVEFLARQPRCATPGRA